MENMDMKSNHGKVIALLMTYDFQWVWSAARAQHPDFPGFRRTGLRQTDQVPHEIALFDHYVPSIGINPIKSHWKSH